MMTIKIFTIMLVVVLSTLVYFFVSIFNSEQEVQAQTVAATTLAKSVHESESLVLPETVKTFIIFIPNEAHHSLATDPERLVSDHNPYYIPTNLTIPQGTGISFLNGDAPWDTPHPHTINIIDSSSGNVINTTGRLDYTNASQPIILPVGKYSIIDSQYKWMKGNVTVVATEQKSSNGSSTSGLTVGGFYTSTYQVENNKDNDGVAHPGSLDYYRNELLKNEFRILSEYNFKYTPCNFCMGGYWPDNKTGDHTLIIYAIDQPFSAAVVANLVKMVKDNIYT
jgi:hypothetical protein